MHAERCASLLVEVDALSTLRRTRVAALSALGMLLAAGCYASNVVAVADRNVVEVAVPTAWHPASASDLAGWFHSQRITGEAALTLRSVSYWFSDRRYSGAALIEQDEIGRAHV